MPHCPEPPGDDRCDPATLAALARAGDLAALDGLTRCQGERLLAIGRRHCRSEDEAQDAVQDALLTAGTNLQAYRGDGPLGAWVGRMVARACGRIRRGRKNDPAAHDADIELVAPCADPELSVEEARLAARLGAALDALSASDRTVLLLDAEGWTAPEIARELGARPDAVRARLVRARRRMATTLVTLGGVDGSPGR
jgi:RNA polymerase sigma-70 factor (ECF subfamily)